MKKSLIIFLAFTFIIGTPGLMLAAEEAVSSPTIDSSSSVSQPTDPSSTVVLEAPTIVDPLETLKSAEQNITDTQISEPLQPESTKIIDSSSSVGSGIVADPVNPVVDANLLNNEAVDAGDEPGRDPGEEEGGAYQQEKSANNSFKKQAGLTGQLRVDQFSGAASYNIGLEAPAGRNGLNPSLLLAYNSHDKSGDSWVGQGWSLPLGSISRTSKRGTNNLYTSNEFTLFLGGSAKEIIEIDADNRLYAPKEESDFLQIQYLPDSSSWLVTDTQGIKYYFGQSVDSRHNDPDDQDKIYSWKLDKVVDTNENFYRVEYLKREGAIYPARFVYTGHGQTDGPMEILFILQEREEDNVTSYQTQFLVTTDQRLSTIEIKVSGQTISRYQLAYTTGQNGRTSLLASITKQGFKDNQWYSLPATTFTYSTKQAGWDQEQDLYQGIGPFNKPDNGAPDPLVDFNGDSWVDRGTSFNDGNGFGGGEGWSFPNLNLGEGHSYFKYVTIGDFNGDKLPDLVSVVPVLGNQGQYISRVWLNNGVNGFSANNSLSQSLGVIVANALRVRNTFELSQIEFADVNGDGLDDLIVAFYTSPSNNRYQGIYLNNGSSWEGGGYGQLPEVVMFGRCTDGRYPGCEKHPFQFADVTGDGLPDIFRGGRVFVNNGRGFGQGGDGQWTMQEFDLPQGMQDPWEQGTARLTDLNGDGLLDMTIAAKELIQNNWVEYFATWLNTGSGWQRNNNWNLPVILAHNGARVDEGVRLMDINNDGAIDQVKSHRRDWNNNNIERAFYLGKAGQANQLLTITNGYGGETELEYQPSGRYFNEDGTFKNPKLPFNLQTVKTITTADGQGNQIITEYDYQDGAFYAERNDHTLNQYAGFGIVTSTTGDQTSKTYYHQGAGIDGYELGEYEDTIYKKGRPFRQELYADVEGEPVLQSAKVSTYKQEDLDNNRKYVYLDGTVAYDYTAAGEQQQMMAPGNLNQAQAVNQQQISQSLAASTLSVNQLSELSAAQTFAPQTAPQLVSQSEDDLSSTYYIGSNQSGDHLFRFIAYSPEEPARDQEEDEFLSLNGDGAMQFYRRQNCNDWQYAVDYARADEYLSGPQVDLENFFGRVEGRDVCLLSRIFLPFNTSDLPDDAIVISASVSVMIYRVGQGNYVYLVEMNTDDPTMRDIRYSQVGNTSGATVFIPTGNPGRYDFNFNQEALSWVDLQGNTIVALRGAADFTRDSGRGISLNLYTVEAQGQQNDPYLTIEYTLNHPPRIPEGLQVEEQVNPDDVQNQRPGFSAIFNDNNQEDEAISYQLQVIQAGGNFNQPLWDSGKVDFNEPVANGQRTSDINYGGNELPLEGYQYFWRLKLWDNGDEIRSEGLWSDGQDYFYMDGSAAPTASANLLTDSRVEPRDLINQQPSFSAIYRDPNPIDSARWYQVQVDDNQNFSSPVWDSQKQELNQLIDNGVRGEEIQYGGDPLPYDGVTYYWRIKFWDDEEDEGTEGAWSESATFSMFNQDDVLNNVQAKAAKFHYDFTTGNLISEENLGTVSAAQNGIFLNIAEEVIGDEKNSTYDYAQPINETVRILSAPSQKVITNPNTDESSTVTISYDGRDDNRVAKANPTKEDLNVPQTVYQKTFNDYGLVTSSIDPLNHQTTVTYDAANYYPLTTRNHLNQTTRTEYDLATGQIKKIIDPNGVVEERDYDAFGRLVEVRKTNPASTNLLVMQKYEYHDTDSPSWVKQINYPGQSFETATYTYFDGLGRTIQTKEATESAGLVYEGNQVRAQYYFEEGEGVIVNDSSNNRNTGRFTAGHAPNLVWTDGYQGGNALHFQYNRPQGNTSSYVYLPTSQSLSNFDYAIAMEATVRVSSYDHDYMLGIIGKRGIRNFGLFINQNHAPVFGLNFIDFGVAEAYPLNYSVPLDEWVTLKGVYNGNVMRLYVNGQMVSENVVGKQRINMAGSNITIGHTNVGGNYYYFTGIIDNVEITRPPVAEQVKFDYLTTSYQYNDKGNLVKKSLPYPEDSFEYSETDWSNPKTEYTYDPQNRVLTEEFIGNEDHRYLTSYSYDGWNVTVTDANGNLKTLYKDAYGQLIKVDEYLDDEVYSTKYEYNLLGKLIKITDSQGNTRNFSYDSLGRLVSQEEMHTPNAQEFGVWSYRYDEASNLIQKTDPKGQVTNYTYDSLNRILTEDYAGAEGAEVSYTYDTGTYGKGRLYRVVSEGATTTYTYDKWGRVTKEARTIDGRLFNTQWAYNLQSVPTSITYPDSSKVYYSYNKEGLPIRLRTAEPGQSIVDSMALVDNVVYSPLKQISMIEYASGVVSANTFDPAQGYRLTHKVTTNAFDEVIQDISYSYDNVGNITQLVDASNTLLAKTTDYEYDDLYRLTSATVTDSANNADYQQTFSYDVIGNILAKSDIGEYLYQNANPYQTNRVAEANYAYDQNGNLTDDSQKVYHYNYADRLLQVDIDEANVLYNNYDQAGQRTIKELQRTVPNTLGGENIYLTKNVYPNSLYEEEVSGLEDEEQNWQTKKTRHITLGNQTIAHVDVNVQGDAEKILVFSDHLGSSSLLTDSMGRVKTLYDYYPFGGTRLDSSDGLHVSAYQYTGKELDEETGLNYFGARYQNADIGRFTQVDPRIMNAVADILSDPQALNGYAYARNNPVRYIDPSGETFQEFFVGAAKGVWEGVKDLTLGVVEIVQNPTVLVTGIVGFFSEAANSASDLMQMYIEDPQGTINQVKEACAYLVKGWENLSDEEKGKIIGYALEKSAEVYFAAKGVNKATSVKSFADDFSKKNLSEYRPTQTEVNPAIVDQYYNKIKAGEKLDPITVAKGKDGNMYILDGHHRYLSAKKAGVNVEVNIVEGGPTGTSWGNVRYEDFTPNN